MDDLSGLGIDVICDAFCSGLALLRLGGGAPTAGELAEAIALAVHREDLNVMGEPDEERARETLRAEYGCPFLEGQVRGDDRRASLVALGEDLEVSTPE